jgi:alanyl aminopeptidase
LLRAVTREMRAASRWRAADGIVRLFLPSGVAMRRVAVALFLLSARWAFAAGDSALPTGKLPADVVPLGYALHITADPRQEGFRGETRIRVRLDKPADHVWLHAQMIDLSRVRATDAKGRPIDASTFAHDDSGLLEVRFGQRVAAQQIELDFDYTAPFNRELQGFYKVKVGDDAYAVTQMEPVSARYAFPVSTSRASRCRSTSR